MGIHCCLLIEFQYACGYPTTHIQTKKKLNICRCICSWCVCIVLLLCRVDCRTACDRQIDCSLTKLTLFQQREAAAAAVACDCSVESFSNSKRDHRSHTRRGITREHMLLSKLIQSTKPKTDSRKKLK